jgi:hypothetical protein
MSRKTLFFLSSDSFHVHVWQNGALSKATYFPHSTEGLEQFSAFLETHHGPAFLLVDLIEEDFRQETVPHLTGANHHALVHSAWRACNGDKARGAAMTNCCFQPSPIRRASRHG